MRLGAVPFYIGFLIVIIGFLLVIYDNIASVILFFISFTLTNWGLTLVVVGTGVMMLGANDVDKGDKT